MNALVVELLREGTAPSDERTGVNARLKAGDLRVVPVPERRAPSREAAIRATRGAGRAASQALHDERREH